MFICEYIIHPSAAGNKSIIPLFLILARGIAREKTMFYNSDIYKTYNRRRNPQKKTKLVVNHGGKKIPAAQPGAEPCTGPLLLTGKNR